MLDGCHPRRKAGQERPLPLLPGSADSVFKEPPLPPRPASAGSASPRSDAQILLEALEELILLLFGPGGDEDGVVAGDGAYDLFPVCLLEGPGDEPGGVGGRLDHRRIGAGEDLKGAVRRVKDLLVDLRAAVRSDIGPRSEKLVEFKVAPLRPRSRKAKPAEPVAKPAAQP